MANNVFQAKRTNVSGRTPNTTASYATNSQYIAAGEFALNMADGILYTSNGSAVIEVGSNNSTQRITNALIMNNDKRLNFNTVNTNVSAYFIQQNDDNFVFYTTNTAYDARPVWSVFANSNDSDLTFSVPTLFNGTALFEYTATFDAGVVLSSSSLSANGSNGSAGQVLTSNGTATYWSTVSGGGGSVDVNAQYNWTNIHTFSANVSFTGNGIGLATNTGAIYLGGIADANWKIGRNTNVVTKWRYTNNSIDIVTANSNLEGFTIGLVSGNSYFETGYLGTYIASNVTIGNSSSNATINSTAFSGTANNTSFVGAVSAANVVSNAQLSSNLSNYQTTAGLSANVATLTANNTSFVGAVSAANVVSNAQLSANLGNYQTTAGLSANVATLTSNNATYFGGYTWAAPAVLGSSTANGASLTYANITGQVNTGTLYVATSANIASAMTVNATGIYPTSNTVGNEFGNSTARWIINAVSYTGGSFNGTSITASDAIRFNTTVSNINATALTTGSVNFGGITQTGSILLGQSTNNQTVSIANGATISGNTKTVEIATSGAAGSQTNITIGTSLSNTLITVNANNTTFNGNVGIGIAASAIYRLQVNGSFAATTKSFLIDHPTKNDMKLRYGSLEGPENGVYVRGKIEGVSIIELPEYWWNLVDENSITVNLTPCGRSQDIWVQSTSTHFIHLNQPADCFFTVFAERKDVEKLVVEF